MEIVLSYKITFKIFHNCSDQVNENGNDKETSFIAGISDNQTQTGIRVKQKHDNDNGHHSQDPLLEHRRTGELYQTVSYFGFFT